MPFPPAIPDITPLVVSYLFSGFTVLMFGINEFCKPASTTQIYTRNVIAQSLPKELTSERNFLIAWVVYVFGLILIFAGFSMLGGAIIPLIVPDWQKKITNETIPILSAFCLVGFLPNIPILSRLEQWWRDFMHRRASIPRAIDDIVEEISSRDFCYSQLPSPITDKIIPFGELERGLDNLEFALRDELLSANAENWILVSAILNAIPIAKSTAQASTPRIGIRFISRHVEHFNSLSFEYKELKDKIIGKKSMTSVDKFNESCDESYEKINDLLERIRIFIACIVVSRPRNVSLEEALAFLYFGEASHDGLKGKNKDEQDALLLSLGTGLLVSFLFFAILPFLSLMLGLDPAAGWSDLTNYRLNLLGWFVTDQLRYVPVAFFVLSYRHRRIAKGNWFIPNTHRVREIQYASLFFSALLLSFFVDMCARALSLYAIWHNTMPVDEFFEKYFTYYWLSPVIISVFGLTTLALFDKLRSKSENSIYTILLPALLVLGGLVAIAGVTAFWPDRTGGLVTYVCTTMVFFVVVLEVTVLRLSNQRLRA